MSICGGYQILGTMIHDPDGIEGKCGSPLELGLLELETTMIRQKHLKQVSATLMLPGQEPVEVSGYEIHAGITTGSALASQVIQLKHHTNGVMPIKLSNPVMSMAR